MEGGISLGVMRGDKVGIIWDLKHFKVVRIWLEGEEKPAPEE